MSNDPRFMHPPAELEKNLHHLSEECGELVQALGKIGRWGMHSVNPDEPHPRETNLQKMQREMEDVIEMIALVKKGLVFFGYV